MTFGNGLAPKSALIKWRGCWFLPDFFRQVVPAVLEYESDGSTIELNQGYRFRGVHINDYGIGADDPTTDEKRAGETSTQDANQEYESGHSTIPGMPSAATVGESNHGDEDIGALDNNASNPARRAAIFPKYGLDDNIDGETWHWAGVLTPTVAIPTLQEAFAMAGLNEDGEEDMPLSDDDVTKIVTAIFATPIHNANGAGTDDQAFWAQQQRLSISVAALAVGHGTTAYVRDPNNTPAADSPAWSSDVFAQIQRAMNDMRADINKILKALAAKQ